MKTFGLTALALIVVFCIAVATRPSTYHVERSATLSAPAESVFSSIDSMRAVAAWNPWNKLDPNMVKTFAGNESGVGSSYSWAGNDKAGEGRMTIVESSAVQKVAYRIEFVKPFASTAQSAITLKPQGTGTLATWSMDGHNDFFAKAFGMFMNMDEMLGKDFDEGLKSLDAFVKAKAASLPTSEPTSAPAP